MGVQTVLMMLVTNDLGDDVLACDDTIPLEIRLFHSFSVECDEGDGGQSMERAALVATSRILYDSAESTFNPPVRRIQIPSHIIKGRIKLHVALEKKDSRAEVGLDLGAVVSFGDESSPDMILVDLWSTWMDVIPCASLKKGCEAGMERMVMCERRFLFLSPNTANKSYQEAFVMQEAIHDATLGGRTWDAACVLSSILACILDDTTQGKNESVVWTTRIQDDYKRLALTDSSAWKAVEVKRYAREIIRIDSEMAKEVRSKLSRKSENGDALDGPVRVLEVGCGGGMTALVMSHVVRQMGVASSGMDILLTDLPEIVPAAMDNVRRNPFRAIPYVQRKVRIGVGALDWFAQDPVSIVRDLWRDTLSEYPVLPETEKCVSESMTKGTEDEIDSNDDMKCRTSVIPEHGTDPIPFDIILAADVAYNSGAHKALLNTLGALSGPKTLVLLAYKPRFPETEATFFPLARRMGWHVVGVLGRGCSVHVFVMRR